MLHILLMILKVIGIVLLVLFLLVLLAAASLLFVPARYRASFQYEESLSGKAWIRWLYPIASVRVLVENGVVTGCLRICGIPVKRMSFEPGKKKTDEENEEKKCKDEKTKQKKKIKKRKKKNETDKADADGEKTEGKGCFEKVRQVWDALRGFFGKWEELRAILEEETTKSAVGLVWMQLKSTVKHLKPKHLELWVRYGTGDPYTLGQHLQVLAILYGLYGSYVEIEPDWDEKVLQGHGTVKGRIRLFTLIQICIKVITNQDVKSVWKKLRRVSERRQTDGGN